MQRVAEVPSVVATAAPIGCRLPESVSPGETPGVYTGRSRQTFQDGKKDLSERIHKCPECNFEINRDIAAAQIICQRGVITVRAVGQIVDQIDARWRTVG